MSPTRYAAALAALPACLFATTTHQAVPPAPTTPDYLGTVVLQTPALRTSVETFTDVWALRLALLDVHADATFDDDRAVFRVYRPASGLALEAVADALADPGGFASDQGALFDAALTRFQQPDAACGGCTVVLHLVARGHTAIGPGEGAEIDVARVGEPSRGRVRVTRVHTTEDTSTHERYIDWLEIALAEPDPQRAARLALALGGRNLPALVLRSTLAPGAAR